MILGFTEDARLPLDVGKTATSSWNARADAWAAAEDVAALQRSLGRRPAALPDAAAVETSSPDLAVDDLVGATFCADDGIADPGALTQGYATLAARAGVVARYGVEVGRSPGRRRPRGRACGRRPARSRRARWCARPGPWTATLAASAGLALPLQPVPRTIVTTGPFPGAPERRTLVIDAPTSFYFHREGDGVLMGMGAATTPRGSTRRSTRVRSRKRCSRGGRGVPPGRGGGRPAQLGRACTR